MIRSGDGGPRGDRKGCHHLAALNGNGDGDLPSGFRSALGCHQVTTEVALLLDLPNPEAQGLRTRGRATGAYGLRVVRW